MNLFAAPGPRWFTIPAHRPFVGDLASGLLAAFGSAPEAMAEAVGRLPPAIVAIPVMACLSLFSSLRLCPQCR